MSAVANRATRREAAWLHRTRLMEKLSEIILGGVVLRAFRSGGGLRVVRLEKGRHGDLLGYGEHPCLNEAMAHAAEDFLAGGRVYDEVYGELYPHYFTGSSSASDELDRWVLRGHGFEARPCKHCDRDVVVELSGYEHVTYPKGLKERAFAGETVRWTSDRGFTYQFTPERIASTRGYACTISVISKPTTKMDPFDYHFVKTGSGRTVEIAAYRALSAPSVEVVS